MLSNEDYILGWYVAQVNNKLGAKAWGDLKHHGFSVEWFSDGEDKPARQFAQWLLDNGGRIEHRLVGHAHPDVKSYLTKLSGDGWIPNYEELPSALEASRLAYCAREDLRFAHTKFKTMEERQSATSSPLLSLMLMSNAKSCPSNVVFR